VSDAAREQDGALFLSQMVSLPMYGRFTLFKADKTLSKEFGVSCL
jgi:hypothetical protein